MFVTCHIVYMTKSDTLRTPAESTLSSTSVADSTADLLMYIPHKDNIGQTSVRVIDKHTPDCLSWPEGPTELLLCYGKLTVGAMRHLGNTKRMYNKTSEASAPVRSESAIVPVAVLVLPSPPCSGRRYHFAAS